MTKIKDFSNIQITDLVIIDNLYTGERINNAFIRNIDKHPEIKLYLENRFTDNRDIIDYSEQVYRIIHNIEKIPRCPICNSYIKFRDLHGHYSAKTCGSIKCKTIMMETTFNEKYNSKPGFNNKDIRDKITNTILDKFKVDNIMQYLKITSLRNINKISKEEQYIFTVVSNRYNNIIQQYKSEFYPFICDFYIPEYSLYIEYHGSQYHNNHRFNNFNNDDINLVREFENKNTTYTKNIIYTWTILDPKKLNIAIDNKLNYLVIYPYIMNSRKYIRKPYLYKDILEDYLYNLIEDNFKGKENIQLIIGESYVDNR